MEFSRGSINDLDQVISLFDANIAWLTARGRTEQWGDQPFSGNPETVEFVRKLIAGGELTLVWDKGLLSGCSIVSEHPMHYVPPANEPELYLTLLMTSPTYRGQGIGAMLIDRARRGAIERGIGLLRVDCWLGGDRKLANWYDHQGFSPTQRIEVRPNTWVQVFEWRPASAESVGSSTVSASSN